MPLRFEAATALAAFNSASLRQLASTGLVWALSGACSLFDAPQPALESLTIRPEFGASLSEGDTTTLRAIAIVGSRPVPVIGARWTSDALAIVSVDSRGRIKALKPGTAGIKATVAGRSATTLITVLQLPVFGVVPTEPVQMLVGESATITAVDVNGPGHWGNEVQWTSRNPGVATVSATGTVTARSVGAAEITGTSGSSSSSVQVVVAPSQRLKISPPYATITVGDTARLSVQLNGTPTTDVTWSSSSAAVASVSTTGAVIGRSVGTARITARSRSDAQLLASVSITVLLPPVQKITVTMDSTLGVGRSVQATAVAQDAKNQPIAIKVTWRSTSPGIAAVSAEGVVTGIRSGVTTIMASAGGKDERKTLRVVAAAGVAVPFVDVVAGSTHTCGRTGSGATFCWGDNSSGQIGDGSISERRVLMTPVGSGSFVEIAAGSDHTCGRLATGVVYCWGDNTDGQLGDGTRISRVAPVPVQGNLVFTQLTANGQSTCAIAQNGTAYCWGANAAGQLGIESRGAGVPTPTAVRGGLRFKKLTAGGFHTCGLTTDNVAYCWGGNLGSQLGDGTRDIRLSPVRVAGNLTFQDIIAGFEHTCGFTAQGTTYCWGRDFTNQLGNGPTGATSVPSLIDTNTPFVQVAAGGLHTCGRTADGIVYCWGSNLRGQLGNGDISGDELASPSKLPTTLRFTQITAGFQHTCGRTRTGAVYCWGDNERGQIGDGTQLSRFAPTPVR